MENRKIIRIIKNKIYLNPDYHFTLEQTNFPQEVFRFSDSQDIYFEVELTSFDKKNRIAVIKVTDYNPKDCSRFESQAVKSVINELHFEKLDWKYIKPLLSSYQESELERLGLIYNNKTEIRKDEINKPSFPFQLKEKNHEESQTLKEDFTFYFKDTHFDLGFASFSKKIKNFPFPIDFKIENSHIIPEFNYIKNYFPNVFGGKKKFKVSATIKLSNRQIIDVYCTSPEIQKIDEEIIDSVKKARTINLTDTPKIVAIDKTLFTSEDIFNNFDDKIEEGNVFKQSDAEILKIILESREIRNQKQLQYLAGSKHSPKQKIRFTLSPNFGFVFFIEGETSNHYCWELLNSHATYLWSFEKDAGNILSQYKTVEEQINIIRDHGRNKYKDAYRSNKTGNNLNFCIIDHRKINSPLIDGFVEWKHKLNEKIV